MLTIQEVGTEILSNQPRKFYVFGGPEYGIKQKYIEILSTHYSGRVVNSPSVNQVLGVMRRKQLIPLQPSLYVVRYDEEFVASLDEKTQAQISDTKIVGTVVCIYEDSKQVAKLQKFLPDSAVVLPEVDHKFIEKYLRSDEAKLNDRFIKLAASIGANYGHARNVARLMALCNESELYRLSDTAISSLFGYKTASSEDDLKTGFAAKNFPYLLKMIESYEGDADTILYSLLSTLLELEKLKVSPYTNSPLKPYAGRWTLADIYNMFMHVYAALRSMRTLSISDSHAVIIYLFGLTTYSSIPSKEDMDD